MYTIEYGKIDGMLLLRSSYKKHCDFFLGYYFLFLLDFLFMGETMLWTVQWGWFCREELKTPATNHESELRVDPLAPNKSSKIATLADSLTAILLEPELLG